MFDPEGEVRLVCDRTDAGVEAPSVPQTAEYVVTEDNYIQPVSSVNFILSKAMISLLYAN